MNNVDPFQWIIDSPYGYVCAVYSVAQRCIKRASKSVDRKKQFSTIICKYLLSIVSPRNTYCIISKTTSGELDYDYKYISMYLLTINETHKYTQIIIK